MARVMLTWELGEGLGHLVNLKPFADGLAERGHQIFAAFRETRSVSQVFASDRITCVDPPALRGVLSNHIPRPFTFAHILHNSGFGELSALKQLVDAWLNLFQQIRPQLIVLDHSPVALLAARAVNLPRCLIGTGFFSPPHVSPLPNLRVGIPCDAASLALDEQRVLSHANSVLAAYGEPPLGQISDLYAQVHHDFLATFPELDHYGARAAADYVGAWPQGVGARPRWPTGRGNRIFAYLNADERLGTILTGISALATPTLVFCRDIPQALRERFASDHMRFSAEPLELREVGRECDLAILNGKHGTTTAMLLAGKPTIQAPQHLEQALFAQAIERLGAGLVMENADSPNVEGMVREALENADLRRSAERFAARYIDFDAAAAVERMIEKTAALLPSASAGTSSSTEANEFNFVDPSELIHPKRFDVMAKIIYGQHRAWGLRSRWAEKIYLTHLQVFNGFVEVLPRKENPVEFVEAFDRLLDSIGQRGFDPQSSTVPVGSDGALLNGAHRLASCLVHSVPIACIRQVYPGFDFSAAWFRKRRNSGLKLPLTCADAMATEYARRQGKVRVVLVAGGDKFSDDEFFSLVRSSVVVVYARRYRLTQTEFDNLMALAALRHWSAANDMCIYHAYRRSTSIDVRILLVEPTTVDFSRRLTLDLEGLAGCAASFLTSSPAETAEVAESLFNPNAAAMLAALPRRALPDLLNRLTDVKDELNELGVPMSCVCLTGRGGRPLWDSDEPWKLGATDNATWQLSVGGRLAEQVSSCRQFEVAPQQAPIDGNCDDHIADSRQHWQLAGVKLLARAPFQHDAIG